MSAYTLITTISGEVVVLRCPELGGGIFPMDESNFDYQQYLAWLDEGNVPAEEDHRAV